MTKLDRIPQNTPLYLSLYLDLLSIFTNTEWVVEVDQSPLSHFSVQTQIISCERCQPAWGN